MVTPAASHKERLLRHYTKRLLAFVLLYLETASCSADWVNHGGNILNHRSASSKIGVGNVGGLALKWKFRVGGDVTATPSISARDEVIYFPSFNGNLYALDANTGRVVWQRNLSSLEAGALARATPVIAGDVLLVNLLYPPIVMALNRSTGDRIWATPRLDANPVAIITMSGTVHDGFYYVGTSSAEETLATNCCSFQGSLLKMRVSTGEVIWRTSMLPDNGRRPGGYAGAAVWGSSPSIDKAHGLVFIATGNNYQVPSSVVRCQEQHKTTNTSDMIPVGEDPCLDPGNNAESIVALDLESGRIVWSTHLGGYDVYSLICYNASTKPAECASTLGPDYDFGEAPMLLHIKDGNSRKKCIVVAGQKSGIVWALDCTTGRIVWWKKAGPGSALGGASWGSATDRKHVFTNIANFYNLDFPLLSLDGHTKHVTTTTTTKGGGWVALDAMTGNLLWAVANPAPNINSSIDGGAPAFGPVSTSHGVLWATSFDADGHVYALHARTGAILWSYHTGATVYGGFSVGDSCVYVGHGYSESAAIGGANGTFLFAFCLPS